MLHINRMELHLVIFIASYNMATYDISFGSTLIAINFFTTLRKKAEFYGIVEEEKGGVESGFRMIQN